MNLMYSRRIKDPKQPTGKASASCKPSTNNPFGKTLPLRSTTDSRPSPMKRTVQAQDSARSISQQHENFYVKSDKRSEGLFRVVKQVQDKEEQSGYFAKSHRKIGAIKELLGTNKTIEQIVIIDRFELAEVLKLIKQEKDKIYKTVVQLQNVSDYYKSICEEKRLRKSDVGINTQQILGLDIDIVHVNTEMQTQDEDAQRLYKQRQNIGNKEQRSSSAEQQQRCSSSQIGLQNKKEVQTSQKYIQRYSQIIQCCTQTQPIQKQNPQETLKEVKSSEKQIIILNKLAIMLSDMNIDYKQILPKKIELQIPEENWKQLSDVEIIKVQKYFIGKLAQKVSN